MNTGTLKWDIISHKGVTYGFFLIKEELFEYQNLELSDTLCVRFILALK